MEASDILVCERSIRSAIMTTNLVIPDLRANLAIIGIPDSLCTLVIGYAPQILSAQNARRLLQQLHDIKLRRKVVRNLALYAAYSGEKSIFNMVSFREGCFLVEMEEEEGYPELKYFQRHEFYIPPRNRFVQLTHNVVSYYGHADWLTQFFKDEASSRTGTRFMANGYGPVSAMALNMKRWKLKPRDLLHLARKGRADPEICAFLESKLV
jgi:hypothetical protein